MTSLPDRTLELAQRIQQIPAPTFAEGDRARFVADQMRAAGLREVQLDAVGNVLARLPGQRAAARPLVISAHLDTVFPRETDLSLRRASGRLYGPGLGDNSLGVAALLALAWDFPPGTLGRDLWLVANTAEEGLGNLRGMKAVVARFDAAVRAYLVLEGIGLGTVYHRALGVRRLRLHARTRGGHAWGSRGQPSAIHHLAALVARLAALPMTQEPPTSLNVGRIGGGTSINTIAAHAWCELDLRAATPAGLEALSAQVEAEVAAAAAEGVRLERELLGERPAGALPADHPLVRLAQESLLRLGLQPQLSIGSTDANLPLSRGYPAVCIGLTRGGGAHTREEYISPEALSLGLEQLFWLTEQLAND